MQAKKTRLKTLLVALTGSIATLGFAAETTPPSPSLTHYPAESQKSFAGPQELFTGKVQVKLLFPDNETAHYSGAYVTFTAGARTAWHAHPAGQHMIVTEGVALTGTRDGKVIKVKEGEAVWCPSNIDHWHGATPDDPMTHLVITGSKDGENVIWKEKVSDKQYFAAAGTQTKDTPSLNLLTEQQQHIISMAAFTANGDQLAKNIYSGRARRRPNSE